MDQRINAPLAPHLAVPAADAGAASASAASPGAADASASPAPSLSIIPPRPPRRAGMPKLALPSSRPSSARGAGAGGLSLAMPTSNGLSGLSTNLSLGLGGQDDSSLYAPGMAPPGAGHDLDECGHATAAPQTIYPDTVPHGEGRHPAALTNDLIRAIGGLSVDGVSSASEASGAGGSGADAQAGPSNAALRLPVVGSSAASAGMHRRTLSSTSQVSNASNASNASSSGARDGDESEEWRLKGHLEDLGRIGEGASGEVKKARHTPTGIVMAVKTISTSPNPAIHRQILRELAFNRTCHSEYIVRYYGAFLADEDTSIVICMEHCEGGSLDGIYKMVKKRNGRTGEKVLGKVAEAGLKGLEYLRQRKIIHRDIKPSNIVVSRSGQIKLCDFGVSGELINSMAGTFTGTSYYMAPERIRGLPYNISSDVWSLGLTILEVASNRFPFPPEGDPPLGPIDLLSYVISMPVPELQDDPQAGVKWGRALRDFVERCLEKDPAKRPGPTKMLSHPFIKKSETRQPQPDIARFIADVWGWPAPPPGPGSEPSSTTATPTTTDAGILGRIPSVRKAPKPVVPLVGSKPSLSSLKIEQTGTQRDELSPATPAAVPRASQLDAEGRTAYERAEAKMREADVGLVGSPTMDATGYA